MSDPINSEGQQDPVLFCQGPHGGYAKNIFSLVSLGIPEPQYEQRAARNLNTGAIQGKVFYVTLFIRTSKITARQNFIDKQCNSKAKGSVHRVRANQLTGHDISLC